MPYVLDIPKGTRGLTRDVNVCACETAPAKGLYRGSYFDPDEGRQVVVNRWLCEQCKENMIDMFDAVLRCIKRQRLTEAEWAIIEDVLVELNAE